MKPGDIVICINTDRLSFNFVVREKITIGKTYKVLPYPPTNVWKEKPWIIIIDDLGNKESLMKTQFCTLEEWRDNQLNKLL